MDHPFLMMQGLGQTNGRLVKDIPYTTPLKEWDESPVRLAWLNELGGESTSYTLKAGMRVHIDASEQLLCLYSPCGHLLDCTTIETDEYILDTVTHQEAI